MTAQIKMTRKEAEVQMACFRQTFSSVRLLNEKAVLHAPQAHSKRTELECRVLHEKRQLTTLDVTPQRAEQIFARYVEVDGEPCVLELVQDLQQDTPEAVVQRRQMLTQTGSMGEKLYRDALTGLDDPKGLEADGVSGATVSTQHFEALWQALQSPMKKGETAPVVVADIPEFSPEEDISE